MPKEGEVPEAASAYVEDIVSRAPPFSPGQIERLRFLLQPYLNEVMEERRKNLPPA